MRMLGLEVGDEVIIRVEDGELRILTRAEAVKRAQAKVRRHVKGGRSLVDELSAERSAEAGREYVLDASAVLALLNQEPGKDREEAVLADSLIGAINYCEVLGKLIDAGLPEEDANESVGLLNLEIVPFDAGTARLAAVLRPAAKKPGLALGDRSCLALALARRGTALTAERAWTKLKLGVKIELIR